MNKDTIREFTIRIPAGTLKDPQSSLTVSVEHVFDENFIRMFIYSISTLYLDGSQPKHIHRLRIRRLEQPQEFDKVWMSAWILTDDDVVQNKLVLWAELDTEKRTIKISSATPEMSQGALSVHFGYKL